MKDLAKIYGTIVYQAFKKLVYFNWSLNPYSAGCFSLLTPTLGAAKAEADMEKPREKYISPVIMFLASMAGWKELLKQEFVLHLKSIINKNLHSDYEGFSSTVFLQF